VESPKVKVGKPLPVANSRAVIEILCLRVFTSKSRTQAYRDSSGIHRRFPFGYWR
jgi:hypothetical protein